MPPIKLTAPFVITTHPDKFGIGAHGEGEETFLIALSPEQVRNLDRAMREWLASRPQPRRTQERAR